MKEENNEIAIISDIHIGLRDCNHCHCWFDVRMLYFNSSLSFGMDKLTELMEKYQITKLENLNGKPCIVNVDNGIVKFVDLLK